MSALTRWWRSLRAFSFPATIIPIALAAALAFASGQPLAWWTLIPYTLASLLFHAGTNVLNDYHDFEQGVDRPGDPDPTHVLPRGLVSPEFMVRSGRLYFALGTLVGASIAILRGPLYLAVGVAGALGAFFYTGTRFSLKYRALGDLAVFVLMGPALVLMGFWALTGTASALVALASLPIATLVTAILHGNNVRDIESDTSAGIDTLAIRLGFRASKAVFAGLCLLPALLVALFTVTGAAPSLTLISVATLPASFALINRVRIAASGQDLIDLPLRAAQLHLAFGLLYATGFVLPGVLA